MEDYRSSAKRYGLIRQAKMLASELSMSYVSLKFGPYIRLLKSQGLNIDNFLTKKSVVVSFAIAELALQSSVVCEKQT